MAKDVVILGAGYAGVRCGLSLSQRAKKDELNIRLVNKHKYHQFIAQLHESAVGFCDNRDIRVDLEEIFEDTNVDLVKDTIVSILPKENKVILESGVIEYDYLVVGLGSEPEYYNIPGLEQYCLTLRSLNSAKMIRAHIERNFASYKATPGQTDLITVVVGGAGFTGIELAGELADWLPELAEEYDIPNNQISVINIEASSSILKGYDQQLVENAYEVLKEKGVRIITEASIKNVTAQHIDLSTEERIYTRNFIWTGGIRANKVITQAGFESAVRGRARTNKYLQAVGFPNVYMVGDNAFITEPTTGEVMGPTAQVAIQSGHVSALNILAEIRGTQPQVFHPKELGRFVSLGRKVGVGKVGTKFKSTGRVAGILKEAIQWKYLYSIGGVKMLAKKLIRT